METYHIAFNGIVQGVGFRPMVCRMALEAGLNGYVKNSGDGVHIFLNASFVDATRFLEKILEHPPLNATILSRSLIREPYERFTGFSIIAETERSGEKQVSISPDTGPCPGCRSELHDPLNRRYRYPFITCTVCGPRYSILTSLPYDRSSTAMQKFTMCKTCQSEYDNVSDKRFFSQSNSCHDCGIQLSIRPAGGEAIPDTDTEGILIRIKSLLQQGSILAVKAVVGYLLLADANNPDTIRELRKRKHRPAKPFALLYPDLQAVQKNFCVNSAEQNLLESEAAPIVLLTPQKKDAGPGFPELLAPGLNRLGVMLPSSPLLELVAKDFAKPLVATSSNQSGLPIIYKDVEAYDYQPAVADYIISYNRDIIFPGDDSVVQVTKNAGRKIFLRRSRGYAPTFLSYRPVQGEPILSTGGFLKSSFSLAANGNVFISQFLGNGESYESQELYRETLKHFLGLYETIPAKIVSDIHPGYFSHGFGRTLSLEFKARHQLVQHHAAHFAAVLAENDLFATGEPILGVIWDGTGLGSDGNLWGGEFFILEKGTFRRSCHFEYFPVIAGDKQALEPRIAALSATWSGVNQRQFLKEKFSAKEWDTYQALLGSAKLFSSSVGRLFDAVASLLDLCDKQSFEGQAAMYLQSLAEGYTASNGFEMRASYFPGTADYREVPTATLMAGIIRDIQEGQAKDYIAAKFHYSLAVLVGMLAERAGVSIICFSGGVFQNALLVDWISKLYTSKYEVYFHRELSPNDESISFGQLVYADQEISTIPGRQNHAKAIF